MKSTAEGDLRDVLRFTATAPPLPIAEDLLYAVLERLPAQRSEHVTPT